MIKPEYTVQIDGVNNGFIVKIGCKTLVFTEGNIDEMMEDLKFYLAGGFEAQNKLMKKYLGAEYDQPQNGLTGCAVPPPVRYAQEINVGRSEVGH